MLLDYLENNSERAQNDQGLEGDIWTEWHAKLGQFNEERNFIPNS